MLALNPIGNVIYYFLVVVFGWAVRVLYPTKVIGKENLICDRGFVLAPNHLSAIDPLYVILARGLKRKMLIMGKEELFNKNWFVTAFLYMAGAFPINRGRGDKATLETAIERVQKGRGLLIFPEGTRSETGRLGKLKSGAFVVAMQAGVDMTPCIVYYRAGYPKLFSRIVIVFGPPLSMEKLGLVGEYSAKKLREAKQVFTQAMNELYAQHKEQLK